MALSLPDIDWNATLCQVPGFMVHPGLPIWAGAVVASAVLLGSGLALFSAPPTRVRAWHLELARVPLIGAWIRWLTTSPWPLLALRFIVVGFFLVVIVAGLYGTPIPERNLATALTWNLWWAGLIISVFFLGSAWCAVCPWDALATWLVRRRLWGRGNAGSSLNLRVPRAVRNVWPALALFVGLTWLELGVGVTTSPYATASLALLMVVLATVSLALFERKAFCRYFCPVGRTVGFYAQLAPVELRPVNTDACARCTTLDCYHGNDAVEPCPTHLVMGRLTQNTYCTSCGNCAQSCPHQNVGWRLRPPSVEAVQEARPHWDEAWFMLGLLALTGFHGVTMMPFWEGWIRELGRFIGDSGQLLWSFSIGLAVSLSLPILLYALCVGMTHRLTRRAVPYKRLFAGLAFVALPLAFAYHLAHNLSHLVRESAGIGTLFTNPLGLGTQPLSEVERHLRHADMLIPQGALYGIQAALMIFRFWIALMVIRHRGRALFPEGQALQRWSLLPMLVFVVVITAFHLGLLMQPMIMRM